MYLLIGAFVVKAVGVDVKLAGFEQTPFDAFPLTKVNLKPVSDLAIITGQFAIIDIDKVQNRIVGPSLLKG